MALNLTNATATMRGVVWHGIPYNVTVEDLPKPSIINVNDAIVRVSHSAICGSDMHIYRGTGGMAPSTFAIGHEAMGWVESIGTGVSLFEEGDWVVIPDNFADGAVVGDANEDGGYTATGSHYHGYGTGEGFGGCQSEYIRIPSADTNLLPVPIPHNATNTTSISKYLFTSDIFATAWAAVTWSGFIPGDTIAVFGAGPVGQLAAYSARLRGASKVYIIDYVLSRLALAERMGAIPINFNGSSPVEQILALEPDGVTRSVDCVGYEAVNTTLQAQDGIVLNDMIAITAQNGGIGQIGVYYSGGSNATLNDGLASWPLADFWGKSLSLRAGVVDVRDFFHELQPLIESGVADPNFIVSKVIGIEEAPEYYARFERHEETKVVIEFPW